MKTITFALSLLASVLPLCAAESILNETFTAVPDSAKWKVAGNVTADKGLKLHAEGDEAGFANASINTAGPIPELNFTEKPVEIKLTDLNLTGEAAPAKQAFVVMLCTDKGGEMTSGANIRLCFNGDSKFYIDSTSGAASDPSRHQTIVSKTVTFPISSLKVGLSDKGYTLEIKDATGEQTDQGEWTDKLDVASWGGSSPFLTIKAVRRPAPGTAEATLGAFSVENP